MRTQIDTVVQHPDTVKFAVSFVTYGGTPGTEYVVHYVTSMYVFDTESDAMAGGNRALSLLETTGKYPNMCAHF